VRTVEVIVDSKLRLDGNSIGHDLANEIFDRTEIPNPEKEAAKRQNRWKWQELPDSIWTGWLEGDTVVIERGYALQLKWLLRENGLKVRWIDRRQWVRGKPFVWRKEFTPRPQQPMAVKSMLKHQQGFYSAPTSSGKTLTAIYFLSQSCPQHTIILVDKLEILNQWISKISEWFAEKPASTKWHRHAQETKPMYVGQIGAGVWIAEPRIVVSTVQSIWSAVRNNSIDEGFFESFDALIHDEAHHVPAETLTQITGSFNSRYRIGLSATPDRKDGRFQVALDVLGEVFHEDNEEELRKKGVLVKPRVEVIRTDFEFTYWGDHESDRDGHCDIPNCRISHRHRHRNNYQRLKNALVFDEERNCRVVRTILDNLGEPHHHLVVSDEIRHLESLLSYFERERNGAIPGLPVFLLTGQVKKKKRQEMIAEIEDSDQALIFATVAKEGLDIPAIDRIYLPFPARNPTKVHQWIGRGTRVASGKDDTLIVDFLDHKIPLCRKQFKSRRIGCYQQLGLDVNIEDAK
jgi:superfamily II DNA or RNA helicase